MVNLLVAAGYGVPIMCVVYWFGKGGKTNEERLRSAIFGCFIALMGTIACDLQIAIVMDIYAKSSPEHQKRFLSILVGIISGIAVAGVALSIRFQEIRPAVAASSKVADDSD